MSRLSEFFATFDVVLCISLVESSERRQHMAKIVQRYNISNFRFIDAVNANSEACRKSYSDGRIVVFPPCFRCGELTCGKSDCNNTLIPPQVATFLSYEKAWQWLVNSGFKNALVVEDDLAVADSAEQRAHDILSRGLLTQTPILSNDQAFLLRFGWALCPEHTSSSVVEFKPILKMSNPCHAINTKMAEMLLANSSAITTTVDVFQHQEVCNETNSLSCMPPLFYELSWSTGALESLIHPKEVRVEYLNGRDGKEREHREAKTRLETHRKHTAVYNVLGLGHPRCGSGYTAGVLNALNVQVGHEKLAEDGIVSWMFASESDAPWALNEGARSRKFKYFRHVIHHVRDPRTAVPSIMRDDKHSELSHQFRRQEILDVFQIDIDSYISPLARAVASLIYWNRLVEQQSPNFVYRIEDQEDKLVDYLVANKLANVDASNVGEVKLPEKNVNADKAYKGKLYEKPAVSKDEYFYLPDELLEHLNDYCRSYGYSTFDKPNLKQAEPMKAFAKLTLDPMGWTQSNEQQLPVDKHGEPLPWWTYPAIEFVHSIVSPHDRVFEYGGGHSTLWWSKRVSQVISVDHDEAWVDKVSARLTPPHSIYFQGKQSAEARPSNTTLNEYLRRNPRQEFEYDSAKIERRGLMDSEFLEYAKAIEKPGGKFDWIVIDGMCRRLCAHFAVEQLAEGGIILFDNSNRSDYFEGYQFLVEQGFYQIRFSGSVPGANFPSCSSIFLKDLNALPKITFSPSMFNIPEY